MRTRTDLIRLLEASRIAYETLDSGRCWMIVAPALAARIMGAGIGEENAFWVPPVISTRGWNEGGNAGGQRTWIAPEGGIAGFFFSADGARWDVAPGLDPGSYRAMPAPAGTILRIRFRHELGKAGSIPLERRIGLWSLIQLPCEEQGVIFIAGGRAPRLYFGELPAMGTGDAGRVVWLRVRGGTRFKAGMSPSDFARTMGFARRARVPENGLTPIILTTMSGDSDPNRAYVDTPASSGHAASPNGDAAQAYCDAGTGGLAFCEIESHAPAPFLAPGESEAQDIQISIARLGGQDIADYMSERLGMEPLPRSALTA